MSSKKNMSTCRVSDRAPQRAPLGARTSRIRAVIPVWDKPFRRGLADTYEYRFREDRGRAVWLRTWDTDRGGGSAACERRYSGRALPHILRTWLITAWST
ncbi:hypothetical protein GCM10009579_66460 [Streptomyces javensis]|uniref:Uncharacterized protein n=1 Tax=Streptomyces javensis TaxID=114698 RepID=A0ABN1X9M0_9ACTN